MSKNKKLILGIVLIIVIIGVASALALYFFRAENDIVLNQEPAQKESTEEENLMKANQEAIDMAKSSSQAGLKAISGDDHVWGSKDAAVTVIIYSDFECPFCFDFYGTTNKIKEEFGDKIAVVFRHYFLTGHKNALPAAIASECAGEQDKFWQMHDKIFEDSREGKLNIEEFKKNASEIGLIEAKFDKCLDQEEYREKVIAQKQGGKQAGVTGTPTIFVNDEIFPGAFPFDDFVARDGSNVEGMKSVIERHLGN